MLFHGNFLNRDSLYQLLVSRIGLDLFKSRVLRLKESKAYNHSDKVISDENEIIFDPSFLEFLKDHFGIQCLLDYIIKALTMPNAKTGSVKPKDQHLADQETIAACKQKLDNAEKLLTIKDAEIMKLNSAVEVLQTKLEDIENKHKLEVQKLQQKAIAVHTATSPINHPDTNKNLKYYELEEKFKQLEMDQEDLFLCLADQEMEIQDLKARLIAYGETFDDDDE